MGVLALSTSTVSKSVAALVLLCIYVSVVLLSFTARHDTDYGAGHRTNQINKQPTNMLDRTYVSTIYSEDQLPSIVSLAHSLMRVESAYGLVLLIPTGRTTAGIQNRRRQRTKRQGKQARTSNARSGDDDAAGSSVTPSAPFEWSEESMAILRAIPNLTLHPLSHIQFPSPPSNERTDPSAPTTVSLTSSVASLLLFEVWRLTAYKQVLYLDPGFIVQENMDHLLRQDLEQVLEASLAKEEERNDGAATDATPATGPRSTSAADTTGTGTGTDTDRAAQTQPDKASNPQDAGAATAQLHVAASTLDDDPTRGATIDVSIERWLHFNSLKERFSPAPTSYATSHLSPVEWADSHAAITPLYLQIAAPMQLTRSDCNRHDAIRRLATRTGEGDNSKTDNTQPNTDGQLLSSSLEWTIFSGGVILLQPNSLTYHLLLSHFTHMHVERRDRFQSSAAIQQLRKEKYAGDHVEFLNRFFQEPCAHSADVHAGRHHGADAHSNSARSVHATLALATNNKLTANAHAHTARHTHQPTIHAEHDAHHTDLTDQNTAGCWHPLSFNFSLTSHTCSCSASTNVKKNANPFLSASSSSSSFGSPLFDSASSARWSGLLSYDCSSTSVWSALSGSLIDTMMKVDQLTIQTTATSNNQKGDKKKKTKLQSLANQDGQSHPQPVPRSSPSYYSQLLSTLSWLNSDTVEAESHRFSHLYLKEMEAAAINQIEQWGEWRKQAKSTIPTIAADAQAGAGAGSASPSVGVPPSSSLPVGVSPSALPSTCCRLKYAHVIRHYFAALRFIRPNFDAAKKKRERET